MTMREALQRLEAACEKLAAIRSQKAYLSIIEDAGAQDALLELDEARAAARASLSTPEPVSVPEGWKLVPVEITDEQADAIRKAWRDTRVSGVCGMSIEAQWRAEFAREIAMYRAALYAAPLPPVSAAPVSGVEVKDLTRPIIGIENRTAQEVFDIMTDRILSTLSPSPKGVDAVGVARLIEPHLWGTDFDPGECMDDGRSAGDVRDYAVHRARAILSHLGIPDTSKEGGES